MRFTTWENVFVISVVSLLSLVPTANAAAKLNVQFILPNSATKYGGGSFQEMLW
jgi:hypothetical protein